MTLTQKNVWNPNNFLPTLLGKTEPMEQDPFDDSRKLKTLERNLDAFPWYHNRTQPDNLYGETIDKDIQKSKVLKRKLRQLRRTTLKDTSGSLLPSMAKSK